MVQAGSFAPAHLVVAADASVKEAVKAGVFMKTADDVPFRGRHVSIDGRELLNFAACSYLDLEQRAELRNGAIEAIRRYGTQFPFPRAHVQCPLYAELESALSEMTGGHALVAASTTLAHIAAIPVLTEPGDAVVVDQFAHASLHTATALLRGIPVEPLRHSRVDELSAKITRLSRDHRRVWYIADGLYSMLGDLAPFEALAQLLELHPQLHLYIDDAHSTSWAGRHGRGNALERLPDRSRVVTALSLNKAFAAGGGALVFSNPDDCARVRRVGGPMLFSGPLQPAQLGAAVASARLHLRPEHAGLQAELGERVAQALEHAREHGVALATADATPIFFVRCGASSKTYALASSLREEGIFVAVSAFPAVPQNQSGIRFTISRHNTPEDIRKLMGALVAENTSTRRRLPFAAKPPVRVAG
jgi:7-keto-8-aminopelargonate synthetase-like enzyme